MEMAIVPLLLLLWQVDPLPDIRSIRPDLSTPAVEEGPPAAGKRVRQVLGTWRDTGVHHALYLPTNWQPGRRYPVIVEYAGNGNYRNRFGDVSEGTVEGSNLGYGLSGGRDFIWISMPFVDPAQKRNAILWWGDVNATVEYCRRAVREVCERWGGDPSAIVLAGFSRGAIACNFIGLQNDEIADVWLAFIPYSHYDGVREWPYPAHEREAALRRLQRLKGRSQFITHEVSVDAVREYLASTGVLAPFTIRPIPFRNHNDAWALRDIAERRAAREWLAEVLAKRPGTHTVSGTVRDLSRAPVAGARVESGYTHFTFTDRQGRYRLEGLIDGDRVVRAGDASRTIRLDGRDLADVDLMARHAQP